MNALFLALLMTQASDTPLAKPFKAGEVLAVDSVCMPDELAVATGRRIKACEAQIAVYEQAPEGWSTSTVLIVAGLFLASGLIVGGVAGHAVK